MLGKTEDSDERIQSREKTLFSLSSIETLPINVHAYLHLHHCPTPGRGEPTENDILKVERLSETM